MKFEVQCEPSFLALGPYHFAVGMNDRSWIYSIGKYCGRGLSSSCRVGMHWNYKMDTLICGYLFCKSGHLSIVPFTLVYTHLE